MTKIPIGEVVGIVILLMLLWIMPNKTNKTKKIKRIKMKLDQIAINAELKDHKLVYNRNYLNWQLSRFDDANIRIIIERIKSKRSLRQLAYLFGGVLPPVAEYTGYSVEELYRNVFKPLYAPKEIKVWRGREIISIKGASKMSKGEMVEFIERIIAEAGEMGIKIISPEEYYKSNL